MRISRIQFPIWPAWQSSLTLCPIYTHFAYVYLDAASLCIPGKFPISSDFKMSRFKRGHIFVYLVGKMLTTCCNVAHRFIGVHLRCKSADVDLLPLKKLGFRVKDFCLDFNRKSITKWLIRSVSNTEKKCKKLGY